MHLIHRVVEGFGCMGDAYVCVDCGLCKYPEVFPGFKRTLPSTPENLELARQAIKDREERDND